MTAAGFCGAYARRGPCIRLSRDCPYENLSACSPGFETAGQQTPESGLIYFRTDRGFPTQVGAQPTHTVYGCRSSRLDHRWRGA